MVAAWSVATQNFLALLTAVIMAMVLIYFFSRATKEVTQDERTHMLYAKASRAAVGLTVPLAAIVSVVLIALKEQLPHDVVLVAYTLSYFSCVILLVHRAFYSYYDRKS
jgi:uncharacterized membrane protein